MTTLEADVEMLAVPSLPVHRRDKPAGWTPRDYQRAPYLRGLPELSDTIALLAGQAKLTPDEEQLVERYVQPIRRAVREASERWHAARSEPEAMPEMVDAWEDEDDEYAQSEAAWASCARRRRQA